MRRVRVDTSTAAYCARASTARFGAASATCAASVTRAFFLSLLLISRAKSPEGQNFRRSRGDLRVLRFLKGRRRRRRVFLAEGLRGLPMVGCSANRCADGPCGSFPYVARPASPWMGLVVRSALRERLTFQLEQRARQLVF